MGMFHKIKVGDTIIDSIDWEMTPELTFGTYESWGGRERVRNNDERIYYFFIDNWGEKPKLCLMERGVKHAKIIAEIQAPAELVSSCVDSQGEVAFYDRSFAFLHHRRTWLKPRLVGLAYEFQQLPSLPAHPWDVPLTAVATDTDWHIFNGKNT